jgi:hypothetical protein
MQYMKLQQMPRHQRVAIIQQTDPQAFLDLLDQAWQGRDPA